eukprot:GHVS01035411.1.p1 GENE.GHVS01035411.1~~GHVS01035411.1.p1  ORF type:complete len:873 (+),score=184.16 GHVS01035411.1:253-2871(+)
MMSPPLLRSTRRMPFSSFFLFLLFQCLFRRLQSTTMDRREAIQWHHNNLYPIPPAASSLRSLSSSSSPTMGPRPSRSSRVSSHSPSFHHPSSAHLIDGRFDFIVVGGGTTGLPTAAVLSGLRSLMDPTRRPTADLLNHPTGPSVLVLESGSLQPPNKETLLGNVDGGGGSSASRGVNSAGGGISSGLAGIPTAMQETTISAQGVLLHSPQVLGGASHIKPGPPNNGKRAEHDDEMWWTKVGWGAANEEDRMAAFAVADNVETAYSADNMIDTTADDTAASPLETLIHEALSEAGMRVEAKRMYSGNVSSVRYVDGLQTVKLTIVTGATVEKLIFTEEEYPVGDDGQEGTGGGGLIGQCVVYMTDVVAGEGVTRPAGVTSEAIDDMWNKHPGIPTGGSTETKSVEASFAALSEYQGKDKSADVQNDKLRESQGGRRRRLDPTTDFLTDFVLGFIRAFSNGLEQFASLIYQQLGLAPSSATSGPSSASASSGPAFPSARASPAPPTSLLLHKACLQNSLNGKTGRIVLAAGALHTPAILMRSGIGTRLALESVGVPSIIDAWGVGRETVDAPVVDVVAFLKETQTLPHLSLVGSTSHSDGDGASSGETSVVVSSHYTRQTLAASRSPFPPSSRYSPLIEAFFDLLSSCATPGCLLPHGSCLEHTLLLSHLLHQPVSRGVVTLDASGRGIAVDMQYLTHQTDKIAMRVGLGKLLETVHNLQQHSMGELLETRSSPSVCSGLFSQNPFSFPPSLPSPPVHLPAQPTSSTISPHITFPPPLLYPDITANNGEQTADKLDALLSAHMRSGSGPIVGSSSSVVNGSCQLLASVIRNVDVADASVLSQRPRHGQGIRGLQALGVYCGDQILKRWRTRVVP